MMRSTKERQIERFHERYDHRIGIALQNCRDRLRLRRMQVGAAREYNCASPALRERRKNYVDALRSGIDRRAEACKSRRFACLLYTSRCV